MYPIRNTVKALILSDSLVLVNKNINSVGTICYGLEKGEIFFDLPGGGQNTYEDLKSAVERECLEETGYVVKAKRLLCLYEEIYTNADYQKNFGKYSHRVYFVYLCDLVDADALPPINKDSEIIGSEWVEIESINSLPFYPEVLRNSLLHIASTGECSYLGTFYFA